MTIFRANQTSIYIHDDVINWKHFPRYWPFLRGIHRSPVNSPHKGQRRGALKFFFDLRLNQQLSKQWRCRWFETPSRSSWRHWNVKSYYLYIYQDLMLAQCVLFHDYNCDTDIGTTAMAVIDNILIHLVIDKRSGIKQIFDCLGLVPERRYYQKKHAMTT